MRSYSPVTGFVLRTYNGEWMQDKCPVYKGYLPLEEIMFEGHLICSGRCVSEEERCVYPLRCQRPEEAKRAQHRLFPGDLSSTYLERPDRPWHRNSEWVAAYVR